MYTLNLFWRKISALKNTFFTQCALYSRFNAKRRQKKTKSGCLLCLIRSARSTSRMDGSVEKTWWNVSNAAGAVVEAGKVWPANKQVRRKEELNHWRPIFMTVSLDIDIFVTAPFASSRCTRWQPSAQYLYWTGMRVIPPANSVGTFSVYYWRTQPKIDDHRSAVRRGVANLIAS